MAPPRATSSDRLEDPATDPVAVAADAAAIIADRTGIAEYPIAVTLGSGWGRTAEQLGDTVAEIPASELPGFSASGVPGHVGSVRSVRLADGRAVLVLGARTHLYENRGVRAVVHGVRVAAALGARTMVLTNGAGGIDPEWAPGTPVLIRDHINLTGTSPLEGPQFVDLTDLYSARLRAIARSVQPGLDEGVYVQFRGPQYETWAEVAMARTIGGTIVGMSTALEAIAARAAGLDVLGFSLITNHAAGVQSEPLAHDDVLQAGRAAEPVLAALLAKVITAL
ncbi:purine-nucleoside phosphorylase [Curtobacterium ammoniigenes]|uniref:purine-nucleoside phosphorylase n=1 Tax=Curtobacterium ammoniigenes TaxID=395387 RepID=UPI00082C30BB|nr:purine-nucleoside phosphorylase [Curtobacterium ammoniigenes]